MHVADFEAEALRGELEEGVQRVRTVAGGRGRTGARRNRASGAPGGVGIGDVEGGKCARRTCVKISAGAEGGRVRQSALGLALLRAVPGRLVCGACYLMRLW